VKLNGPVGTFPKTGCWQPMDDPGLKYVLHMGKQVRSLRLYPAPDAARGRASPGEFCVTEILVDIQLRYESAAEGVTVLFLGRVCDVMYRGALDAMYAINGYEFLHPRFSLGWEEVHALIAGQLAAYLSLYLDNVRP